MSALANQKILLGVSGGIAAYKAPELVRRLRERGADVRVILTKAAAKFVSSLALEVVSGHPVGQDLWTTDGASQIVHTDLGRGSDLILLAPSTANLIARVRHGFADDLLSTTVMASKTPILLCPSMNSEMWSNTHVQQNLQALRSDPRFTILEPDAGELACGVVGPGRLPAAEEIADAAAQVLSPKDLQGLRVTVSAGPTAEDLDPVRFLTNRSTGTMGFEIAQAFAQRGAQVTLVAGPVSLPTPTGVQRQDVRSASEMASAMGALWEMSHVVVMAAAVADWRPLHPADQKLKKGDESAHRVELTRTEDILLSLGSMAGREGKLLVGFAAETESLIAGARAKLERKGLDWIVANDVSGSQTGFGPGDNAGVLVGASGQEITLERQPKAAFAATLVEHLVAPAGERS